MSTFDPPGLGVESVLHTAVIAVLVLVMVMVLVVESGAASKRAFNLLGVLTKAVARGLEKREPAALVNTLEKIEFSLMIVPVLLLVEFHWFFTIW